MERRGGLTEGNVFAAIIRFSMPFLMSNILQALYGASDLFMVGHFSDSAGVSAAATGGQIMQMITGLAIGLTTGGTVVVARHFGERSSRATAGAAVTSLALFAFLSLFFTAGVLAYVEPVCRMMRVPGEALAVTKEYLGICACGIVFIVCFNAVSGILRGLGDSRTPLFFMMAACGINVSTDLLFVGWFRMGAPGAAISTVIAQGASLALAFVYLVRKGYVGKLMRGRPAVSLGEAAHILKIGIPVALQDGLVNLSFLIITAIINGMGVTASAAVGVVEKLIVFSMLPATAFASAVAVAAAQNYGAGMPQRARRCLCTGILLSLLFGTGFFVCSQLDATGLMGLFTSDQEVIAAGAGYLKTYSPDCILVSFVFCMNAYFSGSDRPLFPLLHSLASTFIVRIPFSFLLSRQSAVLAPVGAAAPAATLFSLALCCFYLSAEYRSPCRNTGRLSGSEKRGNRSRRRQWGV